jgi:hypothetical protein
MRALDLLAAVMRAALRSGSSVHAQRRMDRCAPIHVAVRSTKVVRRA